MSLSVWHASLILMSLSVQHASLIHVTLYLCDMPRSNVCITCLVHMHDTLSTCIIVTHFYVAPHLYARLHHREASLCTTYHLHNLDTYARVMSHIWTRHVTHMNASWHTHTRTAPDTFIHLSRMHLCTTHASIYQSPHDPFIRAITHPYVPQLSHICHDSSIYASSDTWSPTLTATHSLQHTLCNTLTATHSQQRTLQRRWTSHMYNVPFIYVSSDTWRPLNVSTPHGDP